MTQTDNKPAEKQKIETNKLSTLLGRKYNDYKIVAETHFARIFKEDVKKRLIAAIIPATNFVTQFDELKNTGHPGYSKEELLDAVFESKDAPTIMVADHRPPPPALQLVDVSNYKVEVEQSIDDMFEYKLAEYLVPEKKLDIASWKNDETASEALSKYKTNNPKLFNALHSTFVNEFKKNNPTAIYEENKIKSGELVKVKNMSTLLIPLQRKTIKK